MSTVQVLNDSENKLLGRRELRLKFNAGNGLISRQGATDAISSKFGASKENIRVIELKGASGTRDCFAEVYIFSKIENVKTQLPGYVSLRHLSKDERKKFREERRKGKNAPAGQAKKSTPEVSSDQKKE